MDIDTQRRFIGQIATDKGFRDDLKNPDKNVEVTLAQYGYPVEPDVVAAIKALKPELMEQIARDVEKGYTGNCQ